MPAVPDIRQAETNECGLAALVMVARSHGRPVDMSWARHRFPPGQRRPDLASMLELAAGLGLNARALRVEPGELARLRLPAILHWEFRHFVVLVRAGRRSVDICDPAAGRRRIGRRRLDECFTGVALELQPVTDFTPVDPRPRSLLAEFLASLKGLYGYLAVMLALMLATQVLALAVPVGSQMLIDGYAGGGDRDGLPGILAGLGCILCAALALDALRQHSALYVGARVSVGLATNAVRHVLGLPASVLERRSIADTLSRIDSLQPIQLAVTETSLTALVQAVSLLVTFALMAAYSPLLAGLSLATLAGMVVLQCTVLPRIRACNMDGVVALAEARQSLLESLSGIASVQAFGLAALRRHHWQQAFVTATNARTRQGRIALAAAVAQRALGILDQLAFLALGLAGIGEKTLTLGGLFAFVTLRGRLAGAVAALLHAGQEASLLRNHLERAGDILAEPVPAPAGAPARRAEPAGRLGCRSLAFAYHGGATLFEDFDCSIEAGERVVICGPSGIGKSTLLRLLAGELEPSAGIVHCDDWDVALWDKAWLRRHFAVVRQSDRLFSGSIADNIACFAPDPDADRLRRAAEQADVWRELANLPLRLETPVGDAGCGLSGGQVQRLLLARALYREPRILFLDEATSQLDARTERRVLGNLAGLGMTIVSVAHGESAIRLGGRALRLEARVNGKSPAALP